MTTEQRLLRIFLCLLFCGTTVFVILFMNQHQRWSYLYLLNDRKSANQSKQNPWYFEHGTIFPSPSKKKPELLPEQMEGDRIIEQLMYFPQNYDASSPKKIILAIDGLHTWNQKSGSVAFRGCPVSRCTLTGNRKISRRANAVLYKDYFLGLPTKRPHEQLWILYLLECPFHTWVFESPRDFNWTATYRLDSDLVAPYEKWVYYDPKVTQKLQKRNYAAHKTKKVAWFVSNCGSRNNRLEYARELKNYISVDVYGFCGSLECSRGNLSCFELLDTDYKFYLAFENSNCRDYITEKFYVNSLQYNVLPIVMGARPEDYRRSAPSGSFIHVDDFENPKKLAEYLHILDKDDELYNSYFQWKGTGEFINTYFWCRLCGMLHAPLQQKYYKDINDWWHREGICTYDSWRNKT